MAMMTRGHDDVPNRCCIDITVVIAELDDIGGRHACYGDGSTSIMSAIMSIMRIFTATFMVVTTTATIGIIIDTACYGGDSISMSVIMGIMRILTMTTLHRR